MESLSSENSNINNKVALNPNLSEIYQKIKKVIEEKTSNYLEDVNKQHLAMIDFVQKDIYSIVPEVRELDEVSGFLGNKNIAYSDKVELVSKAYKAKGNAERIESRLKSIEMYPDYFEKLELGRLYKLEGGKDCLDIENFNIHEKYAANIILADYCRLCKKKLTWNTSPYSSYTKKCSFSETCNTHFRYTCIPCEMKYCGACAFPPSPDICGCGKEMKKLYVSGHSCDMCRSSINGECYRCASCDFDMCFLCYDTYKKK